jgi:hypothetical protein
MFSESTKRTRMEGYCCTRNLLVWLTSIKSLRIRGGLVDFQVSEGL